MGQNSSGLVWAIVGVVAIVLVVVVGLIVFFKIRIDTKNREFVKKTSILYAKILGTNKECSFHVGLLDKYTFDDDSIKDKKELDTFDFDNFLSLSLAKEQKKFYQIFEKLLENQIQWKGYLSEYAKIKEFGSNQQIQEACNQQNMQMHPDTYRSIEEKLYNECKLQSPIFRMSINCVVSRKGLNGAVYQTVNKEYSHDYVWSCLIGLEKQQQDIQQDTQTAGQALDTVQA